MNKERILFIKVAICINSNLMGSYMLLKKLLVPKNLKYYFTFQHTLDLNMEVTNQTLRVNLNLGKQFVPIQTDIGLITGLPFSEQ